MSYNKNQINILAQNEQSVLQTGLCVGILGGVIVVGKSIYDIIKQIIRINRANRHQLENYTKEKLMNLAYFISIFSVSKFILPKGLNVSLFVEIYLGIFGVMYAERYQLDRQFTNNFTKIYVNRFKSSGF
ncbi:hypothetical protein PPERSA_11328 [Pseudocohnilembus persalinus]|uniref:Uncharacterized protein n=1 Tax=Pseudocohnilembus persalinus TaxID=266149 RepID=A0A0V0QPR4_PSEPJ|nr:hypothetical protein PPERSA_11328 [Pseudocohnilembus persalinus]|eukprot:KRX04204.1 hypothetical protein PPERSA_11328 [Pseudocohnilembus persalinus]